MTNVISDRCEYTNAEYANLRICEIQSLLENEDRDDEAELIAERAELEAYLADIDLNKAIYENLLEQTKNNINTHYYALRQNAAVIITNDVTDIERLKAKGFSFIAQFAYVSNSNQPILNCFAGEEGICPICGEQLTYPDQNPVYSPTNSITWHCPVCNAYGQEGQYNDQFDGCHYDVTYDIPATTIHRPASMNMRQAETAIAVLLESFIDNYKTDCANRGVSDDEANTELIQILSGIFQPGNLTHLGYGQYETYRLTKPQPETKRRLIVFNSEIDSCVDMVLEVFNWDENFNHEVDIAVHKWQNSTDEYSMVIAEHLKSVGYKFTIREDCDVYSDYS